VIDDVLSGGTADAAGLQVGDIVLRVDGRPVSSLPAFSTALYFHPLDEVLKLEVLRGTEQKTLLIPVVEMKDSIDALADLVASRDNLVARLGILALNLDDRVRSLVGTLRDPNGIMVVARVTDWIGVETGLETGDIIHSVNRTPINSLSSLRVALSQIQPHDSVVLQVERGGGFQWLTFDMQ